MTASGETPGPPSASYGRPWLAVAIAAGGVILAAIVTANFAALQIGWSRLPGWASATLGLVALSLPLVAATALGVVAGSARGVVTALGLRRLRWTDLALGLGAGLLMRAVVELLTPTAGSLLGPLGGEGGIAELATVAVLVLGFIVITPLIEETFFRGLLARALQAACRRPLGPATGSAVAVVVSTMAFVALHFVTAGSSVPVGLLVGVVGVGLSCGILTVVTGRLWGALVAHVVFNALGVILLVIV